MDALNHDMVVMWTEVDVCVDIDYRGVVVVQRCRIPLQSDCLYV
jgi:hypothetical protein